jgi:hypothetical protein
MLHKTNFDPFHRLKSELRPPQPEAHPRLAFKSEWFVVDDDPVHYVRVRCDCGREEDFKESEAAGDYFLCDGESFRPYSGGDVKPLLSIENWRDVRTQVAHDHDRGEANCPACSWVESLRFLL